MLHVISLGAGVQSSTMALMAAHGELTPMPDCAIFADTGSEPGAVYRHLDSLRARLPFPVVTVKAPGRGLGDEILSSIAAGTTAGTNARPPFFVKNEDGSRGMLRRQCTGDFKIVPIQRGIRTLLGLRPRQRWPRDVRVVQWIGISRDEATRMKPSRVSSIEHRYPLIDIGMDRRNCIDWLKAHDYDVPPKSACTFCPYHSDAMWRDLRDNDPEGWDSAVAIDEAIRRGMSLRGELYLHGSLVPLVQADLSTDAERGQPNLFENECEGMCGV